VYVSVYVIYMIQKYGNLTSMWNRLLQVGVNFKLQKHAKVNSSYLCVCYAAWNHLSLNHAADADGDDDDDVNQSVFVPAGVASQSQKACGFHPVSRHLCQLPGDHAAHAQMDGHGHYVPAVAVLYLLLSTANYGCLLWCVRNDCPLHHGHSQLKKTQSVIYSK